MSSLICKKMSQDVVGFLLFLLLNLYMHSLIYTFTTISFSSLYIHPLKWRKEKNLLLYLFVLLLSFSSVPLFPSRLYHCSPLGEKVSMLTHIYPHKAWRKIEVIICKITRLTAHFMCGWCLICWFALAYKKYGHTWHRMSLLRPGVIKQHKPNLYHCLF